MLANNKYNKGYTQNSGGKNGLSGFRGREYSKAKIKPTPKITKEPELNDINKLDVSDNKEPEVVESSMENTNI